MHMVWVNARSFLFNIHCLVFLIVYVTYCKLWNLGVYLYGIEKPNSLALLNIAGLKEKELALYAGHWFDQLIRNHMAMVLLVCLSSYIKNFVLLHRMHFLCNPGLSFSAFFCVGPKESAYPIREMGWRGRRYNKWRRKKFQMKGTCLMYIFLEIWWLNNSSLYSIYMFIKWIEPFF